MNPWQRLLPARVCVVCRCCSFCHRNSVCIPVSAESYRDMTDADAERPRPRRFRWRTTARLPCCSCLRGEERDPLQERGRKSPHVCQQGAGEREAIHVTLEDLGIVNASFSLLEEGPLTQRDNVIRSASSASTRPRAQRKKRLQHLSSLPVGPHDQQAGILTSQEDNEDHAFENVASGSLLPPPVINLVPPTPSDVVDDDQFFDTDSVEGAAQADGSDTAGDGEQRGQGTETMEADQTKEGFIHPDNVLGVDSEARLECRDEEKDKAKLRLSRGSYQGASLPEYPQKSEFNTANNSSGSKLTRLPSYEEILFLFHVASLFWSIKQMKVFQFICKETTPVDQSAVQKNKKRHKRHNKQLTRVVKYL